MSKFSFDNYIELQEKEKNDQEEFKDMIRFCIDKTKPDMRQPRFEDREKVDMIVCLRNSLETYRLFQEKSK